MPAKTFKVTLGPLSIKGVLRHKWDSPNEKYVSDLEYKTKQLGVYFRRSLAVGSLKRGKFAINKNNLYPYYVIGLHLIYVKCWLEFWWRFTPQQINRPTIPDDGC